MHLSKFEENKAFTNEEYKNLKTLKLSHNSEKIQEWEF